MKTKKRKQNENGFALITVLVLFLALSIVVTAVIVLTDNNTKQLNAQEDHLRAYYIAKSGIEIAYASLMSDDEKNIRRLIKNKTDVLNEENLKLPNESNPIGSVDINVKIVDEEIRIYAVGSLVNSDATASLALYIDQSDFDKTRWGRE